MDQSTNSEMIYIQLDGQPGSTSIPYPLFPSFSFCFESLFSSWLMRGCGVFLRDRFARKIRSIQVNSTGVHVGVSEYLFSHMKGFLVVSSFQMFPYNFRMFFPRWLCSETCRENFLTQWFSTLMLHLF